MANINSKEYHATITKLREFFINRGFIEVATQPRLSILAACEDPTTIATYDYNGECWPLPQTGQMWLEHELLNNPEFLGLFCITTSYRQEKNPIKGRHETIFPMVEFETKGGLDVLEEIERELFEFLGLGLMNNFASGDYVDIAKQYNTEILEATHEEQIWEDYGDVFFLKNFPQYTSPFWNMCKNGDKAKKIDVILCGQETIGSAERSCDPQEMYNLFHTISNGEYASILYGKFGKTRVDTELDIFLNHNFFERCGGGIGITRLIRGLKLTGKLFL